MPRRVCDLESKIAEMLTVSANKTLAAVFCPMWSNLAPIALAYIKGSIKKHTVDCFDFNLSHYQDFGPADYKTHFSCQFEAIQPFMFDKPDFPAFEQACERFQSQYSDAIDAWCRNLDGYNLVFISINQENIVASTVLSRRLQAAQGTLVIGGGPSINMDDHVFTDYLLQSGSLSIAYFGIAEDRLPPLVDALLSGETPHSIPGIKYVSRDKGITLTENAPECLDTIHSMPDYSDFNLQDYYANRTDWGHIYAITGCKARCRFCTIYEFYPRFSSKSVEAIKEEMLFLREKHGLNKIFFSDGMFMGKADKAEQIFDFALEHDFKLGLQVRVMPYWDKEELVRKAAQCVFFFQVGFESGSPAVRREMGKMPNHDKTMSIFNLWYKYELPLYTNIITGYPSETELDFECTYKFLDDYFPRKHVLGIGLNSFFISNKFPLERYNISYDEQGRWRSDIVNISDRVRRVNRLVELAAKHDIKKEAFYRATTVEGVPLITTRKKLDDDFDITDIDFISLGNNSHTCLAGCFDGSYQYQGSVVMNGWARVPGDEIVPEKVLIVSDTNKVMGVVDEFSLRSDVAAALDNNTLKNSGWATTIEASELDGVRELRGYALYKNMAYLITNFPIAVENLLSHAAMSER